MVIVVWLFTMLRIITLSNSSSLQISIYDYHIIHLQYVLPEIDDLFHTSD